LALWHAHRIAGLRHGSVLFDAPPAEVTSSMLSMLYRGDTD